MLSRDNIFSIIQSNADKIRVFGVKQLDLFGSFARNEQSSRSDIDLLVEFQPGRKTFRNYMHLKFLLEELLGTSVDLVLPDAIKPALKNSIFESVIHVPNL